MASEKFKWYAQDIDTVKSELNVDDNGLTGDLAKQRLKEYGPNKLAEEKEETAWDILKAQLKGFFNIVLYCAAVLAFIVGAYTDGIFIVCILILNTALAFYQEYKASRIMSGLKDFLVANVNVIRDGTPVGINSEELVPGDIVLLEEGMKIPADSRLIEQHALAIDEAMLTGESLPVEKSTKTVADNAALGDRINMVFSGTTVVRGTGKALVCTTGMKTELGTIAQALADTETPKTSFELEIDKLSRQITMVIAVLVVLSAALMYLHHNMQFSQIAIFSLSLGVGAIPESLPVVLSFALAMGAQQMSHRRALARRLAIVESLGSVDTICSDKTGTLTKNEMTVQLLYTPGHEPYYVTGEGYNPENGAIQTRHVGTERLKLPLISMMLCNDSKRVEKDGEISYLGDPTEIAMRVVGEKGGYNSAKLDESYPRQDEVPFTSDRQRMTTVHTYEGKKTAITKGAPEVILNLCTQILVHGAVTALTDEYKEEIRLSLEQMQSQALRTLAVAFRFVPEGVTGDDMEHELCFLGLAGMIDPPRPEVKVALAEAKRAGIRTVMITGDHIITAKAIAKRLGMGQNAVNGTEIEGMSDNELEDKIEDISIIARATPTVKLRALKAVRKKKHFAAMTGDGVNDSPALKQADVGIAMGLRGTDAAKQAAGLVLLDDNYATIISAIEEGRRIFDNIRKFVNYLLTCNIGEVITVLLGAIWGLAPLTAIMVLWINILTDVLPAIALGIDPANPGLMKRKPREHDEHILNKGVIWTTVIIGFKKGIENFIVFLIAYYCLNDKISGGAAETLKYAQTMAFTGIVVYAFVRIFVIRTFDTLSIWSNPWLVIGLAIAAFTQLFIIYCPPVRDFFMLAELDLQDWGVLAILAVWASVTGVYTARWVEKWAGAVISTESAE